ncbi:acyl-CoA dehydrogenase [Leptospira wolffii]|uniref:Acyl-CoA dehydrogenase n=1 Tax=Leptospira wolffii TaxID=409998 RepID=A0A2M9Z910_9LEPT|nr:acyl-CoA dehydrogenase family protein [Leptospira wolffii]PJZ64847.1 acyl-CoA dehydrogenase [Leptospira wolffii]TGK58241.1 acyl-CoA dehydrogenase [Leptospira wolffii]TGK66383.1 acyl-CoA dehydrogenase [Leptospira wolffii]TGK68919.1 acyl-CoA dehydrogenase [Leptospira wolffii]TGL27271.1 acyl-CoA dehydrogenase [Leptospira wolffii]
MIQGNYFQDNSDLQTHFEHLIDWEELVSAYEGNFEDATKYQKTKDEKYAYAPSNTSEAKEYYRSITDSLGEIMGDFVAPRSKEMDRIGLKYENGKVTFPKAQEECYKTLKDSGLMPISISRKYGGLGLPATVQSMMCEIAARADAAFCLAYGNINIVEIMERYASDEMCEEWLPQIAAGNFSAAMALTEPNYGSDLPNVQTRATQDADGTWKINGAKRFITHACGYVDSPSVILTLARTGSPESGARGLSFFLVQGKDVQIAGVEHKMGLHCSPTCEVVFENSPGLLIGKTGYGLVKYSMGMMNAARLTIATQSLGIGTAAFFEAKKYAAERIQFGKPIEKIPAVKKILERMEREILATRCLVTETGRAIDLYHWKKERMLKEEGKSEREVSQDENIRRWEKLADLLTPMGKYYASEGCVSIASDALQIHGGSGYTEDYDVARIYRDSRITTIYEGTTQLQVVAAIGGVVSGMAPTGHLRAYAESEMEKFSASSDLKNLWEKLEKAVHLYKSIGDGNTKDELAFETVEIAARFVAGMLLEKSLTKVGSEQQASRRAHSEAYNVDSLAIAEGNLLRLERANRQAAAV